MPVSISDLLKDFSVEMTGKDTPALLEARPFLPLGTRVNVTFLGNESPDLRVNAAGVVRQIGFAPVPHISARRLASQDALTEFLKALNAADTSGHLLVIAGDPAQPEGPYEDAAALIKAAALDEFGVKTVSISGYPEGHPAIPEQRLWAALEHKVAALAGQGRSGDIITQFGFDVDPVIGWIEQVRSRGIQVPIRVGVPGPAGIRRLLSFAGRFGVATSAGIAKKYGFSLSNLLGTTGPDRFITELAQGLDTDRHGVVKLHFYTFGGLRPTAEWIRDFAARAVPMADGQA
ncbi:methylenetetrahydrofolate reductase [Streptomyces sp. NPDC097610]|uniref:methylenetetrahydrofolate reductase n=1 Tax=Streptomyces sp. NPDC097610 TaxID=3157227 RepID=UPI003327F274